MPAPACARALSALAVSYSERDDLSTPKSRCITGGWLSPQSIAMNGCDARGPASWIARAIRSGLNPDSATIRIVSSDLAARRAISAA